MKFKVGDRVRVKEGLENGRLYGDLAFISDMNGCRGEVFEVCSIDEDEKYRLKGVPCFYNDEMLEPAPFGKAGLKTGMRVRYRNGVERIVLKTDTDMVFTQICNGYMEGEDYEEDLTYKGENTEFDIVEVLEPCCLHQALNKDCKLISVWKREENPIEVTIAEIAEMKGVSPERIRIKED